ncbi:hypothetical protein ACNS7O_05270 [Haloferacaceae archaeon DSL9]
MKLELDHDSTDSIAPVTGGLSCCCTTCTCRGTTTSTTASTN